MFGRAGLSGRVGRVGKARKRRPTSSLLATLLAFSSNWSREQLVGRESRESGEGEKRTEEDPVGGIETAAAAAGRRPACWLLEHRSFRGSRAYLIESY